jgi:hypothetical protein
MWQPPAAQTSPSPPSVPPAAARRQAPITRQDRVEGRGLAERAGPDVARQAGPSGTSPGGRPGARSPRDVAAAEGEQILLANGVVMQSKNGNGAQLNGAGNGKRKRRREEMVMVALPLPTTMRPSRQLPEQATKPN